MKIAIPTQDQKKMDSTVELHFGPSDYYVIIDENGNYLETIKNLSSHKGGKQLPPDFLKENAVQVLLCKDLGPRAVELCKTSDIKVYLGHSDTVKEMYKLWKENKVIEADQKNACENHKL